jgi:4-carboxymuconolactone decarboxylase
MKKQTAGHDLLGEFAPQFAHLNDELLFGEVWSREQQLSAHLSIGKQNGISQSEIVEIITHLAFYVGWPKAWSAFSLAKEIYNSSEK